jgi:hypothetical protein
MSRERFILKKGGKAVLARYCLGRIGDRSFSYFNNRLFRPKQYELSVTAENTKAMKIYEKARSHDGASLIPAYETNKTKVIFGRFDSLQLIAQLLEQRYLLHGLTFQITEEDS